MLRQVEARAELVDDRLRVVILEHLKVLGARAVELDPQDADGLFDRVKLGVLEFAELRRPRRVDWRLSVEEILDAELWRLFLRGSLLLLFSRLGLRFLLYLRRLRPLSLLLLGELVPVIVQLRLEGHIFGGLVSILPVVPVLQLGLVLSRFFRRLVEPIRVCDRRFVAVDGWVSGLAAALDGRHLRHPLVAALLEDQITPCLI